MPSLYLVNVTIHLLAALLWLGGMFFLGAVGAPVLRSVEPPELRKQLFHELGLRFRTVGWIAIGVLLVTGTLNLYFRGVLIGGALADPNFWRSPFGRALGFKLACVTTMLALSAWHDFSIGPRAGEAPAGSAEARKLRTGAMWIARVNVLAGLLLVMAAVRLPRS